MIRKNSFLASAFSNRASVKALILSFRFFAESIRSTVLLIQKFHIMVQYSPVYFLLRSEVEIHSSLGESRLFRNCIHDPTHKSFAREYRSRRIENLRSAKFGHDLLFGFHQAPGVALHPRARLFQIKPAYNMTLWYNNMTVWSFARKTRQEALNRARSVKSYIRVRPSLEGDGRSWKEHPSMWIVSLHARFATRGVVCSSWPPALDPRERDQRRAGMSTLGPSPENTEAERIEWRPSANPWMIAASVMTATFMVVLDSSVANVALPHIAGNLSATTDESTWVLTSYLVSNAIMLPAAGWITRRIGRKRLLIISILVFTGASLLCGMAINMPMLIVARILQGIGGGGMQPLAQSILLESFPPRQHGTAMAAYGVGIVVAPVIGPTLGGWITDSYSWRWIFYINLPVGFLALMMVGMFIEDPPYIRQVFRGAIDYLGFGLMAIWLGTLQLLLDKGQEADWFEADWIRWITAVSAIALIGFILREFAYREPIVQLRALGNRNFSVGTLITGLYGFVLYGVTAMLPLFLQTLMGYSALDSGLAVSPRGIGSLHLHACGGDLSQLCRQPAPFGVWLRYFRLLNFVAEPRQSWYFDGLGGPAEPHQRLRGRVRLCSPHHHGHGQAAQGRNR